MSNDPSASMPFFRRKWVILTLPALVILPIAGFALYAVRDEAVAKQLQALEGQKVAVAP